jgi:hypothetical protein
MHEFEQGSHIGQAGSDDTDGRLNACPDTWVDLGVGDIIARLGKLNKGNETDNVKHESPFSC